MKTLLALLLLTPLFGFAQKVQLPLKDSVIVFEEIVVLKDSSVKADKIFSAAQTWFTNTFKNAKSVLQVNDPGQFKLIGKGTQVITAPTARIAGTKLNYSISIDAKDGRYRYRIYNFIYNNGTYENEMSPAYSNYLHDQYKKEPLESQRVAEGRINALYNLINSLGKYLGTSLKKSIDASLGDTF